MFTLSSLIWVVLGIAALAYAFVPAFREQVNTLLWTIWNGIFGRFVSPIQRQKRAYAKAVAKVKEQKESVVKMTAAARLARTAVTTKQSELEQAKKDYADARTAAAGTYTDDELNKLALRVTAAKAAVTAAADRADKAEAAMARTEQALAETTESLSAFAAEIQTNEGKLLLADALNTASEARELSRSIKDVLSDAGKATAEIDQTLAEAEAREQMSQGDPLERKLEENRRSDAARKTREELDAELGLGGPEQK